MGDATGVDIEVKWVSPYLLRVLTIPSYAVKAYGSSIRVNLFSHYIIVSAGASSFHVCDIEKLCLFYLYNIYYWSLYM